MGIKVEVIIKCRWGMRQREFGIKYSRETGGDLSCRLLEQGLPILFVCAFRFSSISHQNIIFSRHMDDIRLVFFVEGGACPFFFLFFS